MSRWLAVWIRAVITPAWRRAAAVWVGAGIGGGIVFGPTGMHPGDLTQLALAVPAVGVALAVTWLLVFVPTARALVHADGARYLRSLPGPRVSPLVLSVLALVGLQLPWLALWTVGDGLRGLALVLALSMLIALIARWQPRPRTSHFPPWTRPFPALRGVYLRALRRRAGDALVRGVGLALLAGLVAGLIVRNNELTGPGAGVGASVVIAVVLLPGWVGALLPLVEAQRATTWLAASLGISRTLRVAVLATVVVGLYVAGTLLALAATAVAFGIGPWLVAVALVTAAGMGLFTSRALLVADRDRASAPIRVVSGAVVAAAIAIVLLGWLGATGAPLIVVAGACALLTARPA